MVNSNFTPQEKKPGDLILSADWNAAMGEIRRLGTAKVNRDGADTLKGPLTIQEALNVAGDVKISGSRLKSADGLGILETNKKDWLRINPDENYPGIALYKPVAIGTGGLAIGESTQQPQGVLKVTQSAYLATAGGNVGVGTTDSKDKLHVVGNLVLGLNEANKKFIFHPRTNANGDFLQITSDKTNGDWNFAQGITLTRGGKVGIDTTTPSAKLQVSGTIQATDNNQTLVGLSVTPTFDNNQKTDVKHLGLQVNGALATTQVETKEVVRLVRGATSNVKNSNSVSLNVGAFESGMEGSSRLDIALAGKPGNSNGWGFVPDVTVMSLLANGRVGIGTISPNEKLEVSGNIKATGAIQPSVGNTDTTGIMFPRDAFGGSGDAAWIRYYRRGNSGENATLEIGISNEKDDHIALMPSAGGVGIGTTSPDFALQVGSKDNVGAWKLGVAGRGSTGNYRQWTLRTGDGTNSTEIHKLRIRDEQASSDRLTIDENGNAMFTGTVTAAAFTGVGAFVTGMILMWSGSETNIPSGWALCDGNNGRPDLKGRFVLGSGQGIGLSNRTQNQIGGVERHQLSLGEMPIHNHGINDPGHHHTWSASRQEQGTDDRNYTSELSKGDAGSADTITKTTTRVTTGISIQNAGSGQAHENMPPFYVLAYIIKT